MHFFNFSFLGDNFALRDQMQDDVDGSITGSPVSLLDDSTVVVAVTLAAK